MSTPSNPIIIDYSQTDYPDRFTNGNRVAFPRGLVPPEYARYVMQDEYIEVLFLQGTRQTVVVQIDIRYARPDGTIDRLRDIISTGAPLAAGTKRTYQLGDCFLLGVSVSTSVSIAANPNAYASIILFRQTGAGTVTSQTFLAAGYADDGGLSWPFLPSRGPRDGAGYTRSITGTQPAAGADISETVPTGYIWQLRAITMTLTTSNQAANRHPVMVFDDGTNPFWEGDGNLIIAASSSPRISGSPGYTAADIEGTINYILQMPSVLTLLPGWRIRTLTNGIQTLDQWSAPQYVVEEWPAV